MNLLRRHGVVAGTVAHLQLQWVGVVIGGGINLNVDAPEFGVGKAGARVVGNQVLGTQFVADLAKCRVQLLKTAGVKVLASGVARELDQGMLSAYVPTGAVFDGNNDDAVQDDLGLLRRSDGFVVVGLADGVTAI